MEVPTEEAALQRLEVAELYRDMGQGPKAAKYFCQAAELYYRMSKAQRAGELYKVALDLDPQCAEAQQGMQRLMGGGPPAA
ncbi:MAG: hypothetical protein AB1758_34975, partial [Candidatus Eremiobacterota bacterium]